MLVPERLGKIKDRPANPRYNYCNDDAKKDLQDQKRGQAAGPKGRPSDDVTVNERARPWHPSGDGRPEITERITEIQLG